MMAWLVTLPMRRGRRVLLVVNRKDIDLACERKHDDWGRLDNRKIRVDCRRAPPASSHPPCSRAATDWYAVENTR